MLKNFQEVLEYGFDVLNQVYFQGELPPIVVCIMSSKKTYGHYTVNKEWRVEDERLHEINISAEHLDRPIENVMATLQHEMVHYYCALNNIPDTSQGGRYHNKNFKQEAEKRGLLIDRDPSIGWSLTTPSEDFKAILRKYKIEKPLDINRDGYAITEPPEGGDPDGAPGKTGKTGKPKSSTRKYICPGCSNTFRATKDINVLCMDCVIQYVKVEKPS